MERTSGELQDAAAVRRPATAWHMLGYAICYNAVLLSAAGLATCMPHPRRAVPAVIAFFLGAAVGSFANQAAYRIPRRMSLNHPPSSCPKCNAFIRRRHNVPIVGWLLLRGRCADCAAPISWHYPAIELGIATLSALAAYVIAAWLEN